MKRHFQIFLLRLLGNISILLLFAVWPQSGVYLANGWEPWLITGFYLTILNALLRPLLTLIALPFLFITLGCFTFLMNTTILWLTTKIYSGVVIETWLGLLLMAVALSVINSIITLRFRLKPKQF